MRTACLAVLCLLGLCSPALAEDCAPPALLNTVKLERLNDQGLVGVPVILNGVEKKFLFDTGGGTTNYISTAVADELHSQYLLGFAPPKRDGKTHAVDVRVTERGLKPRARKSYVAPKD